MPTFVSYRAIAAARRLFCSLVVLAQAASAGKPVRLFNGKNLDGWYTFTTETGRDNPGIFVVEDGILKVRGGRGDVAYFGGIITNDVHANYRFRLEYKWGGPTYGRREGKARDSGILIHCLGADGPGPWLTSIEFQIIEGGTGDCLLVTGSEPIEQRARVRAVRRHGQWYFQPTGPFVTVHAGRINWFARDPDWQDTAGFRGAADIERPVGQWTRVEYVARGNALTYYVNGALVNHVTDLARSEGKILLQTEGAEVWFRDIELVPIEGSE